MTRHQSAPTVLLDAHDVATRLKGVSPRTLERWRVTGQGPRFIKVGHRVLYRETDVEDWLDQQTRVFTHESKAR
jgi:predicted site-specific integrase-resolvase